MSKNQYAAKWKSWKLIPAGAGWAFAVGIIEAPAGSGRMRVRVAKGKMKVVEPGELPITQQAKFNLKAADWEALRAEIDAAIAALEGDDDPGGKGGTESGRIRTKESLVTEVERPTSVTGRYGTKR